MNIFCFDRDPVLAAQAYPDKLAVKMPTEFSQLFATAFTLTQLGDSSCPRTVTGKVRGHFNPKHPCGIWLRESTGNAEWLFKHAYALLEEKYARYPANSRHGAHDFIDWSYNNLDQSFIPEGPQTEFPLCINDLQTCRNVENFDNLDRITQYRLYLKHDKHYATWIRNRPCWLDIL
jgi:hypothetical protein